MGIIILLILGVFISVMGIVNIKGFDRKGNEYLRPGQILYCYESRRENMERQQIYLKPDA